MGPPPTLTHQETYPYMGVLPAHSEVLPPDEPEQEDAQVVIYPGWHCAVIPVRLR